MLDVKTIQQLDDYVKDHDCVMTTLEEQHMYDFINEDNVEQVRQILKENPLVAKVASIQCGNLSVSCMDVEQIQYVMDVFRRFYDEHPFVHLEALGLDDQKIVDTLYGDYIKEVSEGYANAVLKGTIEYVEDYLSIDDIVQCSEDARRHYVERALYDLIEDIIWVVDDLC